VITVVSGAKEIVAAWISARVRDVAAAPSDGLYEAIGFARDGAIIGGVLYTNYRKLSDGTCDIALTVAGGDGWITRRGLHIAFEYPFCQLKCSRITTMAAKSNKRARALNERLGFRLEGTLRGGVAAGRDAVIYGMTREECVWIRGNHGWKCSLAA
jgi:RimJ/RimL family protein N-acetyltransferase